MLTPHTLRVLRALALGSSVTFGLPSPAHAEPNPAHCPAPTRRSNNTRCLAGDVGLECVTARTDDGAPAMSLVCTADPARRSFSWRRRYYANPNIMGPLPPPELA